MALGKQIAIDIEQSADGGGYVGRLVALEPVTSERQADMRKHYTLSGAYAAGDPLLIVANTPITIRAPQLFTKYRVMLRDTARLGHIGLNRVASSAPGQYDDIVVGGNEVEDYCDATDQFSITLDGVPSTPVEVFLYAGVHARPL